MQTGLLPSELGSWTEPLITEVTNGLAQVRETLWKVVKSNSPIVDETARHLINAEGKLFRPLLTLLAASFGEASPDQVVTGAVVCELTHLASLHHDDVMDEGMTRRGVASVNARWGNNVAILTGDYLLAVAAQMSIELGEEALQLHARTARRLVTGQMHEVMGPAPGQDPIDHYMSVASDKTAALISTSARLGAILGGAHEASEILGLFGERLGVAFQIADDLSDLHPALGTGKIGGGDLCQGIETLPVLHARACARPEDKRLLQLLDGDLTDPNALAEALRLLKVHPGSALAQADLHRHVKLCIESLAPLPACPAKQALAALTKVVCSQNADQLLKTVFPIISST